MSAPFNPGRFDPGRQAQQQGQGPPPLPPPPPPTDPQTGAPIQAQPPVHEPTPEELAYIAACGEAILAGSAAAKTVADAQGPTSSEDYLRYAQGVKFLTDALTEIKTGGRTGTPPHGFGG